MNYLVKNTMHSCLFYYSNIYEFFSITASVQKVMAPVVLYSFVPLLRFSLTPSERDSLVFGCLVA